MQPGIIVFFAVFLYLFFLWIGWPQTPDDMPGGGWAAVHVRAAFISVLLMGITGTVLVIGT